MSPEIRQALANAAMAYLHAAAPIADVDDLWSAAADLSTLLTQGAQMPTWASRGAVTFVYLAGLGPRLAGRRPEA